MLLPANRLVVPSLKPRPVPAVAAQKPQLARRSVAAIESDRTRLFVELTRMRDACGEPAQPLQNALVLLTSKWSRASWKSREQLLKAADWLLRLENQRSA